MIFWLKFYILDYFETINYSHVCLLSVETDNILDCYGMFPNTLLPVSHKAAMQTACKVNDSPRLKPAILYKQRQYYQAMLLAKCQVC